MPSSSYRRLCATVLAFAACALIDGGVVRADDPVATSVTYNREVVRILRRKCFACHGKDGIAMSLATFRDARPWGRAMREELVEQRMPPSVVAPGASAAFANDLGLTFREMTTLLTWLDGGMPQGNAVDLPVPASLARATSPSTPADVTLSLPPQTIPALEELVVKEVTIDAGLSDAKLLSSVTVRPGSRRVLRGALVYAAAPAVRSTQGGNPSPASGQWLGAWMPWQTIAAPPGAHGYALPAGTRLRVVLYYRGDEATAMDQSSVELRFAPATSKPVREVGITGAPVPTRTRATAVKLRADLTLPEAVTIWALQPTTDASARSVELVAERPDGTVQPLVYMPQVRKEWPAALLLKEPMALPAGTKLRLTTEHAPATTKPSSRVVVSLLP